MNETPSVSETVRNGFERACNDFSQRIAAYGFIRAKKKPVWERSRHDVTEVISLRRSGSSYGAPNNYSLTINVQFSVKSGATEFPVLGPSDEFARDERGYAYHLRFNTQTGSTYERCIDDLARITEEHGLPWFASR